MKGIDVIKVINLEHRSDRWDSFVQRAEEAGFTRFNRFPACDGQKLTYDAEIARIISPANDFSWRRGYIGCGLSHYRVWQAALEVQNCWTLVLEDDVFFSRKDVTKYWDNRIYRNFASLPDADLVYLGGHIDKEIDESSFYLGRKINNCFFKPPKVNVHLSTCSYAINLSGVRKLLYLTEMVQMHRAIDYFLIDHWPSLNIFFLRPFLFRAWRNYESDIQYDHEPIFQIPFAWKY